MAMPAAADMVTVNGNKEHRAVSIPSILLCGLLAVLPAFGGERVAAPLVSLYTSFQQTAPGTVVEALRTEVDAVMAPMGMHFEWRSLAGARGNETVAELAVVTFRGRCDASGLMARPPQSGPLGWTHVSDGVILPFSDIDCDRIRLFLQRDLLFVRADEREEMFGRAVARVLAHELYHIFAHTTHHAPDGVAKSTYTVQELLSGNFQFEERDAAALHTSSVRTISAEKPAGTP
jgi:hypothetical protein